MTEESVVEITVENGDESESDVVREVLPRSTTATTMISFDFTGDGKVISRVQKESVVHAEPET